MHKIIKYTLALSSALLIACGTNSQAESRYDTETPDIECLASDFWVSGESIRSALGHKAIHPISVNSDLKCSVRLDERGSRMTHFFIQKETLGVRVFAGEGVHSVDISVMSKAYRNKLKAIHLLYMSGGAPKRIFSYLGTEGNNHWVQTRLFSNRDYFLCGRTTDYILVLEWADSVMDPVLAQQFTVKNAPIACEYDV